MDAKRREYDVVVIGEEPHLAYNRVGLTSFFQHRKAENLYLNPREWVYCKLKLHYQVLANACVSSILVCQKVPSITISIPR